MATSGAGGLGDPGMPGDGDREAAAVGAGSPACGARGDEEPERPPLPAFCVGDGVPFLRVAVGEGVDRECFAPPAANPVPAALPMDELRACPGPPRPP
jgi:hypothetical protein